ncbi:MAG: hypothetical protein CL670_08025 [Balneola sp.]|nr:hypothetical protein [Balneola sp.]MBE79085.1 hypothetical protein [Balneola sp.]|tara:strand:- start:49848 stop:52139 length:2292 start_codon:yes stop_codon:yes gene_type:complete
MYLIKAVYSFIKHNGIKGVMVCLVFMGGISFQAVAQDALLRTVVLSEEDGSPMVGANVLLYDLQNEAELLYNCVTNSSGFCEIRNIDPSMEYELRISYVGFTPYAEELEFEPDERKNLRVELETKVGEFDDVVVRGDRIVATGEAGVRRISNVDISRIPTPGVDGDLVSYMQSEPGIVTTGDRGGDVYIRGGTPDQNLVLVDNLPIVKPFHISNLFSAFSDEIIQNVDLYAGGYGAEFTGASSAIVDVKLRPGNFRRFQSSAAVSPYMVSMHAEGPIKSDEQSFILMGRYSTIEDLAPTIIGEEIPIRFTDVVGRYTVQGDGVSCSATGIYTYDDGEVVPIQNVRNQWTNTVLGGSCLLFTDNLNYPVRVTMGYTNYENIESGTNASTSSTEVGQIYMNVNLREEALEIPVNYGFGVNFKTYNVKLDNKFLGLQSEKRLIPILHSYVSGQWKLHENLTLQPGITAQLSLDNYGGLEPRLRASWKPDGTDNQELSLATGRFVQLFYGASDQRDIGSTFLAIRPVEQGDEVPASWHGIVAYQQRFGDSFITNLEGYVKTYQNILVSKWTPEARIELETAQAEGISYGFDIRARYLMNPFFVSVGYGWSKVTYKATSGNLGAWIQEPIFEYSPAHDQRHKLNTIVGYKFAGFEANVRWEFGTGKPYTQIFGYDFSVRVPDENVVTDPGDARILYSRPFGERLPYYHRMDVSLNRSFEISENWSMKAETGVINAYNRNNVFNFDINTLQRVDQAPLFPYLSVKLSKN